MYRSDCFLLRVSMIEVTVMAASQCVQTILIMGLPNNTINEWKDDEWENSNNTVSHVRGVAGLVNLGNTCYMNAALQCLFHNESINHFIHDNKKNDDKNIASLFVDLLFKYKSSCGSIDANDIHLLIKKRFHSLNDSRQHDAQEFLALLLDILHEQMNQPADDHKRVKLNDTDDEALHEWRTYCQQNQSLIVESFQGQLKSTLRCVTCDHVSSTFEPFMYLSVPLPHAREKQLVVCHVQSHVMRKILVKCDKYDTGAKLKQTIKQKLDISEDVVCVEVSNNCIQRQLDDCDNIVSISSNDIYVYSLNSIDTCIHDTQEIVLNTCTICLDDKPMNQLLYHSQACNGFLCANCLDTAVRHYTSDDMNVFSCPTCSQQVTHSSFIECDLIVRCHVIPILFRCNNNNMNELICPPEMLRVPSRVDSSMLYSLVDSKVPYPTIQYKLHFVERDGMSCSRCCWGSTCQGCEVARSGSVVLNEGDCLCVHFECMPELTITTIDDKSMIDYKPYTKLTLNHCIDAFISSELLDDDNNWYCPQCQCQRSARKSLSILQTPPTIIIYLKRFLYLSNCSHKLDDIVIFPTNELDFTPFIVGAKEQQIYSLSALICHNGNTSSGHYTAYAKHLQSQQWYYFNDDIVTCQQPNEEDSRAYILFYTRQEKTNHVASFSPEVTSSSDIIQSDTINAIIETIDASI